MSKYLEIWKLTKTFPSKAGPVTVVEDFDLSMRQGEFVAVIGHSGAASRPCCRSSPG
jgi:ABC-type nitrate/sulfonate/bicarbonate transport system ATPase subunit